MVARVVDLPRVTVEREIDDELAEITGHLNAQHGRLVDVAIRILADNVWAIDGIHSPSQYLAWKTGLSPARAREIIAIAERASELPACVDALRGGELAVDQVAAIAKRAPAYIDTEIDELGRMLSVTQLRRLLARYPFPEPPVDAVIPDTGDTATAPDIEPDVEADFEAGTPEPHAGSSTDDDDRFWCGVGDDGRWRLHVETDQLTGMMFERALDEARDALFNAGNVDVTMVDALREIGQRSLDTVTSPERRDRFRTYVHIDTNGAASDGHGCRLPDCISRYITCDGLFTPTFTVDGVPISVGRTQRAIPERTRRFVVWRDQGCRIPGCDATHHLEVHHIIHWEDDGPTDSWNLIALCPRHHRLHHRGKLGISGNADDPDGIHFTKANGQPFETSGARPEPPGAPPPSPRGTYQPPLGERLRLADVYFRNPPWQPPHTYSSAS